jgi:RNA polymerase sigma factor (sigma-70 family)
MTATNSALQSNSQQWLAQAQGGDPVALANLLQHIYPDLRLYAQRHCHAQYAEDAIQETLLVASRKIETLRQLHSFSAWLITILKRHCHHLFRKFNIDIHLEDTEWAEFIEEKPPQELRLDLIAALESLPEHYLHIILLRDFEERTISEIAAHLNENIPAVKSRLHRARTLVREYLLSDTVISAET